MTENVYNITNNAVKQVNSNIPEKLQLITEELVKAKYDNRVNYIAKNNLSRSYTDYDELENNLYFKNLFEGIYLFSNNYKFFNSFT